MFKSNTFFGLEIFCYCSVNDYIVLDLNLHMQYVNITNLNSLIMLVSDLLQVFTEYYSFLHK